MSPHARDAIWVSDTCPELKILKEQFESALNKVKPNILYAFRTLEPPSFDEEKIGKAFLYLMSHVDPTIDMVEGELVDERWTSIQSYLKGNCLSLKRKLEKLPSDLVLVKMNKFIYKNLRWNLPGTSANL